LFGFALMGIFPLLSVIYCPWVMYPRNLYFFQFEVLVFILLFILTIISYIIIVSFFLLRFFPKCLHFWCKFNKVPKEYIEEYLEKNPVIKNSWSKYKLI
jgi:hypothetical protein